jgi:hypothetical protein
MLKHFVRLLLESYKLRARSIDPLQYTSHAVGCVRWHCQQVLLPVWCRRPEELSDLGNDQGKLGQHGIYTISQGGALLDAQQPNLFAPVVSLVDNGVVAIGGSSIARTKL